MKKTIFGSQVLWQQYYEGSPISGAWIKVDIDKDGKVFNVVNELVPVKALATARKKEARRAPLLSNDDANTKVLELAQETKGATAEILGTKRTVKRVKKKDLNFLFTRKQRAFKEVMVYFHIDRVQRYIQSLGFKNVLNHPIEANIDGQRDDNSHYSPTTKPLTFGTGGVDDAEDAEIILHEYGHAVQDDQVPGWGETDEGGAMGEGFVDYLAGSFFSDSKPVKLKPTIGNWDAVAYSGDDPPCLRRLDSNKKYPKDKTGEVHDDGEIWSACLWELRAALGRRTTDKLVIAHHFLLSRFAEFKDGALRLITADKQLNGGANQTVIRKVFVRRGILPNDARKGLFAGLRFNQQTPPGIP